MKRFKVAEILTKRKYLQGVSINEEKNDIIQKNQEVQTERKIWYCALTLWWNSKYYKIFFTIGCSCKFNILYMIFWKGPPDPSPKQKKNIIEKGVNFTKKAAKKQRESPCVRKGKEIETSSYILANAVWKLSNYFITQARACIRDFGPASDFWQKITENKLQSFDWGWGGGG